MNRIVQDVICRIGSLEKKARERKLRIVVICRIGSLESYDIVVNWTPPVICRIGSLETQNDGVLTTFSCYLPYR